MDEKFPGKTIGSQLKILILGLDTFASKNIMQVEALGRRGFSFDITVVDSRSDSEKFFSSLSSGHNLIILERGFLARFFQVLRLLKNKYHHVELYSASRFVFVYWILLKIFRKKVCVIERGDIGSINEYPFYIRFGIRISYMLADVIWYKEPYMKQLLLKKGARRLFFQPNAARHDYQYQIRHRDIDFIWANRLIPQRYINWVMSALRASELSDAKTLIMGILPDHLCDRESLKIQRELKGFSFTGLTVREFSPPADQFRKSKFFILPAKYVFGNNSLLEAMSMGVIPIITDSPGIELLITDGVNGFISEANPLSFQAKMIEAFSMQKNQLDRMSRAAHETIKENFNPEKWEDNVYRFYESL